MSTTSTPQTQAKAIVAGILTTLLAGASSLATVLTGDATLHSVTQGQWLAVLIAMLTAGGSVYGITYSVTNAPAKVATQDADGVYNVTYLQPSPPVGVPLVTRSFDEVVTDAQSASVHPATGDVTAQDDATGPTPGNTTA